MGALRIVAAIVSLIGTAVAEVGCAFGLVERNAGMTMCLQRHPTVRAGNCLRVNGLAALRTAGHSLNLEEAAV